MSASTLTILSALAVVIIVAGLLAVARRRPKQRARGAPLSALAQVQDIGGRKRTERALQESEARFRTVLDALNEGLVVQDASGAIAFWNASAERILGLDGDQLAGRTSLDPQWHAIRESGEDWPKDEHPARVALLTGKSVTGSIMGVNRSDGSIAWLLVSAAPLLRPGETTPFGVVASFTDITEHREALASLRVSEERLELALEGTQDGLWDWNVQTGHVYFSPRWCRMLGYEPDEVEPHVRSWERLVHPDDMGRVMSVLAAHLEGRTDQYECEHRVRARNGSWVWILDRGKVVERDGSGAPVRAVGTHTDVTERRRLEEQLRQSQKMEAVGRLAGGVAHDFNNLLTVISANVAFLREQLPVGHQARADVEDIARAATHAAVLTRKLLAISRQQTAQPRVASLNAIVAAAEPELRTLITTGTTVELSLDPNASSVRVDPAQVEQMLVNLVSNARDAMPNGGTIAIETANEWLDDAKAAEFDLPAGTYVRLSVRDTGTGIDPGVQARLFEPFFTTKTRGRGLGLGLASVQNIVRHGHGHITCRSTLGSGTVFDIYLPAVEGLGAGPGRTTAALAARGLTVLVVDDEPSVRAVVERILVHAGYRVLTADSAETAIALLKERSDEVNAMLTDMIMPGLNGDALAEYVLSRYRHIGVAFMSGFIADAEARTTIAGTAYPFMSKPFDGAAVDVAVRAALALRPKLVA